MDERDRGPHVVLVVLQGSDTDGELIRLACQLARGRGATLRALYVIEVPLTRSLADWHAPSEERAREVLAAATTVAQELGCTVRTTILPARNLGSAIADEATEWGADLLLVELPRDSRSREAIWQAVEAAPCAVLLWQPRDRQ